MRRMGAKATSGGTGTRAARESISREPTAAPPNERGAGPDERASDQRVAANSRSSLTRARAMASRAPRGRTRKTPSAEGSRTTVSLRRPSTSSRPTRA